MRRLRNRMGDHKALPWVGESSLGRPNGTSVPGVDVPPVAVPLPMLDLRPSWVRGAEASEGTKTMATSASRSAVMICSGACLLLPNADLPVAGTRCPDPNIRPGLVSGGHVTAPGEADRPVPRDQLSEGSIDSPFLGYPALRTDLQDRTTLEGIHVQRTLELVASPRTICGPPRFGSRPM